VTYRVEFGGGAQIQFHTLPAQARDALIDRAVELAGKPWDDVHLRPPGGDTSFREAVFDHGRGLLGFHVDEDALLIRIFDIMWLG
jgi:hypothetical protein